ncbi:MSHA biogenesis protein MshI [Neptunicella sp.]|uniref:MSHA biogenesis protein MshI n=1 Tax=Neptunicella sp. TaxID=2125986 RepID=UPI003F68D0B6
MHIGWRGLIKQYLNPQAGYCSVGIEVAELGIHISVFDHRQSPCCWIKQHFIELDNWPVKLKQWVQQFGLQNSPCKVVVSHQHYQLFQVERPSVDESELRQALRWSVKDLLSDNSEVVIDYFEHPAQVAGTNKVSVVAMPKAQVLELINHLSHANLQLDTISIEEMAMCELFPNHDDAKIILGQHVGQELYLNIIYAGKLYFTRRLKGYALLSSLTMEELQQGLLETLALEIQRSMDYFESQLHQAPIRKVGLVLDTDFQQEIAEVLQQLIYIQVEPATPDINCAPGLNTKHAYFTSLGAGLMRAESSLKVADEE